MCILMLTFFTHTRISLLPPHHSCRKFADFVERTRKNAKYVGMLESIDEEH